MNAFLILATVNTLLLVFNIFNQVFAMINGQKKNIFRSLIELFSILCYFFLLLYYFLLAKKTPSNSIEILFCFSFVIYFLFSKRFLLFFANKNFIALAVSCYVLFLHFIVIFGLYQLLNGKNFSLPLYSSIYYLLYFFLLLSIIFYFCCYFYSFFYRKYFLQIKYKKKSLYFSKLPNIFNQEQIIEKLLLKANLIMFIFLFSIYFIFLLNSRQIINFLGIEHLFLLIAWLFFVAINIYQRIKGILPQYLFFILSVPFFILFIFLLISFFRFIL